MSTDVAVVEPTPPLEVVNQQTGEVVTVDPYQGISCLALTRDEAERLTAPIPVDDLDILPTGEVYATQVRYRRVLNSVFGPGQWGLRPMTDAKVQGNVVMRMYALYVRGMFVSEAPGECDYQPSNSRMSYATALEAARSNALTRCCKDLGIASECWDKHFCDAFKAAHCETYRDRQGQTKWRRKSSATTTQARTALPEPEQVPPPKTVTPEVEPTLNRGQRLNKLSDKLAEITKGMPLRGTTLLKHVADTSSFSQLTDEQLATLEAMTDAAWEAKARECLDAVEKA